MFKKIFKFLFRRHKYSSFAVDVKDEMERLLKTTLNELSIEHWCTESGGFRIEIDSSSYPILEESISINYETESIYNVQELLSTYFLGMSRFYHIDFCKKIKKILPTGSFHLDKDCSIIDMISLEYDYVEMGDVCSVDNIKDLINNPTLLNSNDQEKIFVTIQFKSEICF